jgi:hypothetical protein
MLVKGGVYHIVNRTKAITLKQVQQIADILGVKGRFTSLTVDFIKEPSNAKKAKKAKKKR